VSDPISGQSDGWVVKPLSELAEAIQYGYTAKAKIDGDGVRYLRITDIQDDQVDWSTVPSCDVGETEAEKYLLSAGDLVFARTGATVGKSFLIRGKVPRCVFASYLIRVKLRSDIDPRYVSYFFRSPSYWNQIAESAAGIGQPNVNGKKLAQIRIPVAPKYQQREIVAEIEKQFSRLDEAVANLRRVKANLKRYKASVLKAAVEGRLVPTKGDWKHVKLGEVALSVRNGYSHKPDAESGTRIFRISAVRPMELGIDDVRYLSGQPADYDSFLAAEGDVLFTRYNGSRDYVGVCALVPAGLPPTVYPDKLIRVRISLEVLLPSFLVIAASTGQARDFVESMIRTTAGQSGVSGSDIKAIPLSIPSIDEQILIVAEVDRCLSIVREVEAEVDANLKRAQKLREAHLSKAFNLSL
jgi:type I restriction enzyme S subunit